jgi:HD-like signal output (HDOD) protein
MFQFFVAKKTDPKTMFKKVLGDHDLPSFPDVVLKTLEKTRDPNASSGVIAQILAEDPGLTVRVLRTVNSAAFSPIKKIENLTQAISLMGMSSLESLVLSMGVSKTLLNEAVGGFNPKLFWQGSARRAYIAKALSQHLHPQKNMESFTAGLLQDMALPFLVKRKTEAYDKILKSWDNGERKLHEMEKETFGWDHAEVATLMCWEWKLPESLASAIGGHNQPEENGEHKRPAAVFLVSLIRNSKDNPGTEQLTEAAQEKYGMEPEMVKTLIEESFEQAEELVNIIGH